MSENQWTSFDSPSQLWKWATLLLLAQVTIFVSGSIVRAKSGPPSSAAVVVEVAPQAPAIVNEAAPQAPAKAETPKSKPAPRVVAANTQPASPIAPRSPSSTDIAACNQYAAAARTQPQEVVRDGVIGAALGAGVNVHPDEELRLRARGQRRRRRQHGSTRIPPICRHRIGPASIP